MTRGQVAVQATQLSKSFAGRAVLKEIDLSIATGETVVLTGANGAGKTTLLRCLAGRIRPDTGVVYWQGHLARGNPGARRLIGMAAHDLRTPLAVVEMYAKFLLERAADRLPEKEQELLRTIVTRSQFMLGLINDLLDVSKIEAGSLELNRHPGNWMSFLRHNAALNGELAARKEVRVAVAPEGGSFTASFDRGKMDQVLDNLMDNAVKFSPRGSTVTVTVTEGEGLVRTAITDEGEGIPEEELPRLFEAFHRGTTSPTAGESGTGLGLAIARRIVEGHSGTIGAESRKGRGTTFFFTLPVA